MNMQTLNIGQAINLMVRTAPVILIRLGVNLLFWIAAIIYFAVVGTVAVIIGNAVPILGFIIFIVALVGLGGIYNLVYRSIFYVIKAAHIALIAELLETGKLKRESNLLSYGRELVQTRFGEISSMFVVDELVAGVIRAFTRTVYQLTSWLPGDALRTLIGIVNRIIYYATNYIDEAVLARSFYQPSDNVWGNARDGVVLYAMKWRPILLNAIVVMIISYIPFIVTFLVFSLPVGLLLNAINPTLAGWSLIFLLLLSWMVKVAIGDTFAMIAIIATYHRETRSLQPDPNMVSQLNSVSDKFQELINRARESLSVPGQPSRPAPVSAVPITPAAPPPIAPVSPPPAPSVLPSDSTSDVS